MKKEIVICHDGHAELVDEDERVLWSSDTDEDFRDVISQELLTADDADDILDYLAENEIITDDEAKKFEEGTWSVSEEVDDDGDLEEDDDLEEEGDIIDDSDGDDY